MGDIEKLYSHDITRDLPLLGKWEFPPIYGTNDIPESLISFHHILKDNGKSSDKTVHFYIDDYKFERLWNTPDKYIPLLKQYRSVFTPDFSMYLDYPLAMQIYNCFRSRVIGYLLEQEGIKVIPTLQWCDFPSFDWCFEGLPQHKVYTVSTMGVEKSKTGIIIWKLGMKEALKRVKPSHLIIWGHDIGFDFKGIPVTYIQPFQWTDKNNISEANNES